MVVSKIVSLLKRKPLPHFITNILLMIKFGCKITLDAKILYPHKIKIGKNSRIYSATIIPSGNGISIANNCEISDGVILDTQEGSIEIARGTRIGAYCVVYGGGGVKIGEYTMIAANTAIFSSAHSFQDKTTPMLFQPSIWQPTTLEGDNWIGSGTTILQGVTIKRGTIIGAGSVVTKDIGSYKIAYGVPAKEQRER